MKAKHTPGPWWAWGLEVGTVPMMDIKIARVSGANFEEAKANARLIAAAPDLLDMLTEIVTIARTGPHFAISGYSKQIDDARKLIARLKEAS